MMRLYTMSKHKPINWRDLYRLPVALWLYVLTWRNYEQRYKRELPDVWYWADERLFFWGYAVRRNKGKKNARSKLDGLKYNRGEESRQKDDNIGL